MSVTKFLEKRSSTILTYLGAFGVVATAVTAVQATPKALDLIEQVRCEKVDDENPIENTPILTPIEMVQAAWKPYVPSVLIGAATIACLFGANGLNKRQQAVIASAYIFLDQSYKEYKKKVNEVFGPDADLEVKKEIAKDKAKETDILPPRSDETMLFYEEHYGEFFERTMLEVQDAEYQLNRKLAIDGDVTLNDFFRFLGLDERQIGDAFGWSCETICDISHPAWIDFEHELIEMDDGMECQIITTVLPPVSNFA